MRIAGVVLLASLVLIPVAAQPPTAVVVWLGTEDTTTQGDWKGVYGSRGGYMHPETIAGGWPVKSFAVGAKTNWEPKLNTDDRRYLLYNATTWCCDPLSFNGGVLRAGDPFPPHARAGLGLLNRPEDGCPLQVGLVPDGPRRMHLYLLDQGPTAAGIGRVQRIDVYEWTDTPGCLQRPSPGRLLDSRIVAHFAGGTWVGWDILQGGVILQFTSIAPTRTLIPTTNWNGTATISGILLDPIPPPTLRARPAAPRNLRVLP